MDRLDRVNRSAMDRLDQEAHRHLLLLFLQLHRQDLLVRQDLEDHLDLEGHPDLHRQLGLQVQEGIPDMVDTAVDLKF